MCICVCVRIIPPHTQDWLIHIPSHQSSCTLDLKWVQTLSSIENTGALAIPLCAIGYKADIEVKKIQRSSRTDILNPEIILINYYYCIGELTHCNVRSVLHIQKADMKHIIAIASNGKPNLPADSQRRPAGKDAIKREPRWSCRGSRILLNTHPISWAF